MLNCETVRQLKEVRVVHKRVYAWSRQRVKRFLERLGAFGLLGVLLYILKEVLMIGSIGLVFNRASIRFPEHYTLLQGAKFGTVFLNILWLALIADVAWELVAAKLANSQKNNNDPLGS